MNEIKIVDTYELPIDSALYGHRVKRRHRSKRIDVDSNVALLGRGCGDGQDGRRRRGFGSLRFSSTVMFKQVKRAASEQQNEEEPEPDMPLLSGM